MFGRQRRLEVSSLLPTPNTGNLTLTACHHFSRGPKWFRFLIQNHFEVTTRYRSGKGVGKVFMFSFYIFFENMKATPVPEVSFWILFSYYILYFESKKMASGFIFLNLKYKKDSQPSVVTVSFGFYCQPPTLRWVL